MAKQGSPRLKTGFHIKARYIVLFFVLTFFVLGGVYLSQQTQLKTIAEEKTELQSQLDDLKVEQERLERMLEYMQTTDYLLQYAREKLGYVFPDDWKFYDDTDETADAASSTETATPSADSPSVTTTPQPSISPSVTSAP